MRSPENGDTTDGIAFARSIMFITESDLLCLTAQVHAHRGASELGELGLSFRCKHFVTECIRRHLTARKTGNR